MSEQTGGRYQRSAGGLVVALVVTLLAVAALVGFRALLSQPPEVAREPVEYLEVVRHAQRSGHEPVYPRRLPEGWTATDAQLVPEDGFAMTMLTADERFVGLRQQQDDVDDLVEQYVDENADEGESLTIADSVSRTWTTYTDDGGDTAYASEVDGLVVFVYGSADPSQLEALLDRLVTTPAR